MLKLEHISKTYNKGTVNETVLFDDFNLQIQRGDFVSVVGSNGSGKTSILNIICGSIPLDSGDILIENNDIKKEINNIIRKNASSFAGFIEKETQSLLSQKLISEMDYTSGLYNCDELYVNAIKTVFDLQYKSKKNKYY